MAKHFFSRRQRTPYDIQRTPVFWYFMPKIVVRFWWVTLQGGAKYTWGRKNLRLSTNNSLYFGNGKDKRWLYGLSNSVILTSSYHQVIHVLQSRIANLFTIQFLLQLWSIRSRLTKSVARSSAVAEPPAYFRMSLYALVLIVTAILALLLLVLIYTYHGDM